MTKYIPLEEVEKIFNKYNISTENGIREKILSLPTIDPIDDLKRMIAVLEENKEKIYPLNANEYDLRIATLQNAIEFISDNS